MTTLEMLFAGYCLATGIVMGWLWASAPLKRKVVDLENLVKWERVKVAAAESDLARVRAKLESPRRETKKA
jgi:hypothetical protein